MVCAACGCVQSEGVHFCKQCGQRMDGVAADPASGPAYGPTSSSASGASFGQQPWMPLTSYPGYPAGYVPLMETRRERVRQNLQPMGIVWCLWGVYRLLLSAVAGFALHTWSRHRWFFGDGGEYYPHFFSAFVPVIAFTTLVMASLALLTGYGLLTMKPWARTLAIVMAILSLIKIPLGTALGIYTLWVLGPRISGMEYDAMVRRGDLPLGV